MGMYRYHPVKLFGFNIINLPLRIRRMKVLPALMKKISRIAAFLFVMFLALLAGIWCCNYWVISSTQKQLYNNAVILPFRRVGIVLGANKWWHGQENPFFKYRIEAAAALYKAGKVSRLIVSGDNHTSAYDEPMDMKKALVEQGVPDSCITLDYAGFRTFDSVLRCKEVFGQDSVTIISQGFQNQRAIFIANYYKMSAVAFDAGDVAGPATYFTAMREYLAKCKVVLDLYVLHTAPHFLGQKVKIQIMRAAAIIYTDYN